MTDAAPPANGGWLGRLKQGLSRTSTALGQGLADVFGGAKVDAATLEELEERLVAADLGVPVSARVANRLVNQRTFAATLEGREARLAMADEIALVLKPVEKPLVLTAHKPFVILVVGVNGTGKTTTIGKLANHYKSAGKSVLLCAADTFRAAAIEQLEIWGERTGVVVIRQRQGSDPSAVMFDALQAGRSRGVDYVIVDTAGRLHTKENLMGELEKMRRTAQRVIPDAPHEVLLVMDATTGQNGLEQARKFTDSSGVTGIVLTKLDGTAKGGVVVAIARELGLPIRFVGVGEQVDDLLPFEAEKFVQSLFAD